MSNLDSFYTNILNIRKNNYEEILKEIVLKNKKELILNNSSLEGLCKVLANSIIDDLKAYPGITINVLDLNELIGVDHVSLIDSFYQNALKRYLVDPSFTQFTKSDNKKLIGFNKWPSELIDKEILNNLLMNGLTPIDDYVLNNYLNSFLEFKENFSLEETIKAKKNILK